MRSVPLRRLLVVSHVVHYRHDGVLSAYGPYSREIDIWADLFAEVVIAAPCRDEQPPADCVPFSRGNIAVRPQPETGGRGVAKLWQCLLLPRLVVGLAAAMWRADAIHVRCPGNLGLLGALMAPLFTRYRIAKYAGQWNGYLGEPATVRLQRAVLASRWWGSPVTVYGDWPNQPPHIVPFFTSMMTAEQQRHAAAVAAARPKRADEARRPLRVLFAGSLVARKRVVALLDALALCVARGTTVEAVLLGDGSDAAALRRHAAGSGLSGVVRFVGAFPFDESLKWYEWADCLVLPSQHSEGWPKVVAEAMSHGLICIAVDHGQLRAMLDGRGLLVPTGTPEEIADALARLSGDPDGFEDMRLRAVRWATQYSLEGLRSALADLLAHQWNVERSALGHLNPLTTAASGLAIHPLKPEKLA